VIELRRRRPFEEISEPRRLAEIARRDKSPFHQRPAGENTAGAQPRNKRPKNYLRIDRQSEGDCEWRNGLA